MCLNGESPRTVQEQLGHSHVSITLALYTHVYSNTKDEAADRLEALLWGGEKTDESSVFEKKKGS
jgi:integrase